jgi:hypothetical protein
VAVLLYYPLVNPPEEILYQALLYWDGVASLVPRDRDVAGFAVSARTRELEQQGLYSPVIFDDLDRIHLDDQTRRVWDREIKRLTALADPPRLSVPPEYFLYWSKTSDHLLKRLLRLGLPATSNASRGSRCRRRSSRW